MQLLPLELPERPTPEHRLEKRERHGLVATWLTPDARLMDAQLQK